MYIQTLQVFCDLAESGSFSRAAVANGVSQSAVSQQIRALEKELGVCLVDRSRSGLSLSAQGQVFLRAAREILAIYDQLPARLADVDQGATGNLRIAAVYSIGLYELPGRVKHFRETYPGVNVQVEYCRASQVYASVLDGSVDVGLVAFPSRRTGLHVEVFDEDELVLICPPRHPLVSKLDVSLKDLNGQRFVAFGPDIPTRKAVDRYLRDQGVRLVPHLEFDNVEIVKRAVEVDGCVSLVPRKTVLGEVERGSLVVREILGPPLVRPLGILFRHNRPRPPAWKAFLEAFRKRHTSEKELVVLPDSSALPAGS